MNEGERKIIYIEIRAARGAFEVWRHEKPDIGNDEFTDVVEFSDDEENKALAILQFPSEALQFAHSHLGADPKRWVNCGVVGEEYKDYVIAGRLLRS